MRFALGCLAAVLVLAAAVHADERVRVENGKVIVTPVPLEKRFLNPTTPEYEKELLERSNHAIAFHKGKPYGNTYFENEKNSYPVAMLDFLAGNREKALATLQANDNEPWNAYTLRVDFYPSFTLKGQVRKYFFFGPYLAPEYRKRMLDAAKIWTETDPLRRKIPGFEKKQPGPPVGWTPDQHNSAVDVRMTDNLRAMREVGVYLFAEEAGNEATRQIYKERIRKFAVDTFMVGHGEWDSNNYLSHTFTAYLGLYDYAKDPEVKLLAKAALDFMAASAAVKYYRADFGGPSKRDYGGKLPYGSNAANGFSWYFGDNPTQSPAPDRDDIHSICSAYRPPQAVVALAQKRFDRPVEVLASKPTYEVWKMAEDAGPSYFETTHIGRTYQLGSLPQGSSGDENGLKLMTWNSARGADSLYISSGGHDPKGISTGTSGGEQIGHYRNLMIVLNGRGEQAFNLLLPKSVKIQQEGNTVYLGFEKTHVALHLVNARWNGVDAAKTQAIGQDKSGKPTSLAGEQIATAAGSGGAVCGFVLEIGEAPEHASLQAFIKAVQANARVDMTHAQQGDVAYRGSDGATVRLARQAGGLPKVWRNGVEHDFRNHWALWQAGDGKYSPIRMGWKTGELVVEAGGHRFVGKLSREGKYDFQNSMP